MVVQVVDVDWVEGGLLRRRAGWHVVGPGGDHFWFPRKKLKQVPRQVRHHDFNPRFDALIAAGRSDDRVPVAERERRSFLHWWNQVAPFRPLEDRGGTTGSESLFRLDFTAGDWDIPWEVLVKHLRTPVTSIVRTVNRGAEARPTKSHERLRTLVLLGEANSASFARLDLCAEAKLVREAWENLEEAVQEEIVEPEFEAADRATLADLLRDRHPHLLVFSGHGTADPEASLLFAGDDLVNVNDLRRAIQEAEHCPHYVVLWACETARTATGNDPNARLDVVPALPDLCAGLIEEGALSVLAMQAPVRDVTGRVLAADLFRYVATGFPLERALARARSNLMSARLANAHPMDFATPVVWSGRHADGRMLEWGAQRPELVHLQIVGRDLIRGDLEAPAQVESIPTESDRRRAASWLESRKTWIQGLPSDAEHTFRWTMTLVSLQQLLSDRYVVAIDLDPKRGPPLESMRGWAARMNAWLRASEVPRPVSALLHRMEADPTRAWRRLCQDEAVFVAVRGAPAQHDAEWFWKPLAQPRAMVALLGDGPWRGADGWDADNLTTDMSDSAAQDPTHAAPRLASALAVLNMPLRPSYVALAGDYRVPAKAPGVASLVEWPEGEAVLVDTEGGPVLASTARRRVLESLDERERLQAQMDCVEMLGRLEIGLTPKVRGKRLRHLLDAYSLRDHGLSGDEGKEVLDAALREAGILIRMHHRDRYPLGILDVSKPLGDLATSLSSDAFIYLAWAHLRLGMHREAEIWLRRVPADSSSLDLAWKHGMKAELLKASGVPNAKALAYAEVESAIDRCHDAVRDRDPSATEARRALRAYRQDRARMLHHLQRRVEQAIQEYEALIEEWTQDPEAQEDPETQVDLAIVKRNYSEALRAEAPRSPDPATQLQRARDALDEAHELVAKQRRPDEIPVFSEILYEKARLAEAEGKLDEALELLNQAHGAARKSGHRMLEAIAASRKHWLLIDHQGQPFDLEAWREHVDDLACFPDHGWAVRKLIDGRTRTARVLADSGQTAAALEWLQANLEDFARNPSFDEGSDRRRIAVTYAGLAHLGDGGDAVWADFRSRYGWADGWLDHHEVSAPSDTWERHADG